VIGSAASAGASIRFADVSSGSGIDLVMTSGAMPSREILEVNGGGVAFLDHDNDGDFDLFFANGSTLSAPERGPGSRLYSNRGDGTFEDVTAKTGIDLRCWAMGVAVGDYDGDGWDDLYVTCFGPNVLLRNVAGASGGRRFVDVTARAGVGDSRWSTSAAFGDLDGDGDLDLFVANYLRFDPKRPPDRAGARYRGVPVMAGPRGLEAERDTLYENLGDGTFREVTQRAGIVVPGGLDYGLVARIVDLDGDGRQDIFVGNDSTANQLYRNLGGLRFADIAATAGVAASGQGVLQATMGLALADVDGNGTLDLFNTAFSDDTNTLRLNLGDGLFEDRSAQLGVGVSSRPYLSWGCGFFDFDLDGDEDLLVTNGHVYPEMGSPAMGASWAQETLLYERRGRRFERVTDAGEPLARKIHGRAVAFGDLDGDQDVDVVLTTLNGPPLVLRNEAPRGAALAVELAAPPPNRHAYGAIVELEGPAGVIARRWITGGGSYQSVDAAAAYFGLGGAGPRSELRIRVRWPDGSSSVHPIPQEDRTLRIEKPTAASKAAAPR